ncbi:MAG TPA: septum formation initiator family protein [Candidatus Acidoferrales bacterium]|nr:septum formation initiator family protein [Candidatus Acidoferrales bacterium]
MNESNTNAPHRDSGKTNDVPVSFFEQLGQFFHRNMYTFLIVGFALLLLQDVFGTHGVLAMRRSKKEAQEIQKDISRLDEKNRWLQDRVKALKTDPAAIEKIMREEMKLKRPGEVVFETHPKPKDDPRSVTPRPDDPPKKP